MSNKKNAGLTRRASGLMALEPRFMFDGAAVDTAVDALAHPDVVVPVADTPPMFDVSALASVNLGQAMALVQEQVRNAAAQWSDAQWMQVFGIQANDTQTVNALYGMQQHILDGSYQIRVVEVDAAHMGLSMAAFTAKGPDGQPTIFLNSAWWAGSEQDPRLVQALLEEVGHSIDAALHPQQDTPGDEGQLFAMQVLGLPQNSETLAQVMTENDAGQLLYNGEVYQVEHASFNFTTAYALAPEYRYYAEKEQESDRFLGQSLGVASINDNTSSGTFSGNDVVVDLTINGTTYHGWISRPIKDQGVVRGFYFWYDPSFTTFQAATLDGNQDGDSNAIDNQGFVLVVDQNWFSAITAGAPVHNNGSTNANVYEVGSSSDRVDSALNGVLTAYNSPPVLVADTRTITEGTLTATGNVLTNDSDPDGNTLSVTEFAVNGQLYTAGTTATLSGVGTLVINSDGSYTFTPVNGYTGTVPVATYKVSDGLTTANTTLTITVTPVNSTPDAVNDTGTVTEDVALMGNLITNDTDPDGDTLTMTGYTFTPAGGTLTSGVVGANTIIPGVGTLLVYNNGSYSFTPAPNYDGAVPVISYTISDGHGGTDTATLTLTITPVPDGPALSNDTSATGAALAMEQSGLNNATAGQDATGNVLSNDTAGSGSLVVVQVGQSAATSAVASSSTSASNGTVVVGRYGSLTMGANGSYKYVVNDADPAVQALRLTGQTLSESFTYSASDGSGMSATATLTVTIDGRNDTPVAVNDYNLAQETTTVAGSTFASTGFSATGNVLTNDTDVDGSSNGETKTLTGLSIGGEASISSYTSPASSTKLIFRGDSGFNSVNGGEELYVQVSGVYYLVFDSAGVKVDVVNKTLVAGTTADYEITLSGTPAKYSTGTAGSYTAIASLAFFNNKDVGFENSTTLTENTSGMKIATSASGVESGSVVSISASYTGTIAVGMEVSGTGITAGTTISEVTYTSGVITSVTLNKSYAAGTLSGNLTFTKAGTLGATLTGQHGTLLLNADGSYTYTPTTDDATLGAGETATEAFSYTMKDASNVTSTATLYITVLGASNGAPVAVNDVNAINEGVVSVSKTAGTGVLSNDSKDAGATVVRISSSKATDTVVDGNNDYEVAGLYGTLKIKADGSYTYTLDASNAAVNALHASETLTDNFQYVLNDPSGSTYTGVDAATLSITVNGVNDLPVGGKLPDGTTDPGYDSVDQRYEITTPEDTPIKGQVKAYDADDASLTYAAGTAPTHGVVVVNANGSYTYTPNGNYTGTDQFTVSVSDGHGGTTSVTVYVTVTPVNDPPFLDLDGSASGTGYATSFTLGGSSVAIADTDRLITDVDNTNIASATVILTNAKTGDVLSVGTLPVGISANTSVAGQITLSGAATLADYQAALQAIGFVTSGGDRTERSISVVVNDGNDNSNVAYTSIGIRLTPLTVEGVTVNEASPYAVFRVNGASGQTVQLALNQTGHGASYAVLGMDTSNAASSSPLQYLNASNQWVDYTPGASVTMSGSTLLVRTAIRQDQPFEGLETYALVATDDAGVSASGQGGIIDDGTGQVFLSDNTTFTPSASTAPGYPVLDDDRTIAVMAYGPVNEASAYAMFTVNAIEGYALELALQSATTGNAATRTGFTYEYSTNGSTWVPYTWNGASGSQPTVPVGGKVYVRVDIASELDGDFERAETFALKAWYSSNTAKNSAADTTIVDDGTGIKYSGSITSGSPVQNVTHLDDDRTLTVTAYGPVNEASTYAMFTVTALEGYELDLDLQAATSGTAATRSGLTYEWSTDGSTWTTYSTNSKPTAPVGGKVYARVDISAEHDNTYEGAETFALKASYTNNLSKNAAADTSIVDDGTGTKYGPNVDPTHGPDSNTSSLDDDRVISLAGYGPVNEGSQYAMFTVTATPGQQLDLALQNATSGTAATWSGFTSVQFSTNGTTWTTYDASHKPTAPAGGKVYVRVDIGTEADANYEGAETFALKASFTSNAAKNAAADTSIVDDGTGTKYGPNVDPTNGPDSNTSNLDDDRPISVTGYGPVNEGSQYAMFTVTSQPGQQLDLALQNATSGTAATWAGFANLQFSTNGTTWTTYDASHKPTVPAGGEVYVRVDIGTEADAPYEGAETFALKASWTSSPTVTAAANTTIVDDGTGTKYGPNVDPTHGPDSNTNNLDNDQSGPITVAGGNYNEASPRAVFTVTATSGQVLTLDVQNAAQAGKAPTGDNEGKPNDSLDTAPIYYSLDGGATWQLYTGPITAGNVPVLVAVDITNERDAVYEGEEQLKLVVTSGGQSVSGHSSIFDDGTGTVTREITAQTTNNTGVNDPSVTKDNDREEPVLPPVVVPPPPTLPAAPSDLTPPPPVATATPAFASALQPLAPRTVATAEPPLALVDVKTSASGYQIAVNETAPPGLTINRGVTDQFVQSTQLATKISLPFDAFMHSNKDAVIKLQAKLADNSSLPKWVQFDPATGVFEVTPPKGFKGKIDLKVVASDDDGREATAIFQLFVGEQTQNQAPVQQSRHSFSDKLRMAGKRPVTLVRVAEVRSPAHARETVVVRAHAG